MMLLVVTNKCIIRKIIQQQHIFIQDGNLCKPMVAACSEQC